MLLINEMQSNIPAWDFVRALQILADRCQTLKDLGPEGGDEGGQIVGHGSPNEICWSLFGKT